MLWPPVGGGAQGGGQQQQVRVAVADFTPSSVLCWAPTTMTMPNSPQPVDTLVMALHTGDPKHYDEGGLMQDIINNGVPDKQGARAGSHVSVLRVSAEHALPPGAALAYNSMAVPNQNCVLGPRSYPQAKGVDPVSCLQSLWGPSTYH